METGSLVMSATQRADIANSVARVSLPSIVGSPELDRIYVSFDLLNSSFAGPPQPLEWRLNLEGTLYRGEVDLGSVRTGRVVAQSRNSLTSTSLYIIDQADIHDAVSSRANSFEVSLTANINGSINALAAEIDNLEVRFR